MPRSLTTLLLAAGLAAVSQDLETEPILQVARAAWPGGHTIAVACNYETSGPSVRALLGTLDPRCRVLVADVRSGDQMPKAFRILAKAAPRYVLLIPDDPVVRDGSWEATRLIHWMQQLQVPTLATRPAALAQGALAVMGPATGNALQVNPDLNRRYQGIIGPVTFGRTVAQHRDPGTRAALSVVRAE